MNHLELHIIQSVPVACLNRDDLNSPKTAVFGGVQRARVSSQSWKRAIRKMANKEFDSSGYFKGERSRLFMQKISSELVKLGEPEETAKPLSLCAGHYLGKIDPKHEGKVKTLMFLSPLEYNIIADLLYSLPNADKQELIDDISRISQVISKSEVDNNGEQPLKLSPDEKFDKKVSKILKKLIKQSVKGNKKETNGLPKDAADIALFGRMVANDHSLTVEAASMFSHALSTHKVDNEIDFFAAVDDLQPREESGAGMTSTLEFNSATYYRFAALNLDMLADDDHLNTMSYEERQSVVRTFIEATVKAIPGARKNTMNGNTLPVYVLGVIRKKGHPIQLVNAFENSIRSAHGYVVESINRLNTEYVDLKETWGIDGNAWVTMKKALKKQIYEKPDNDISIPGSTDSMEIVPLKKLIDGMVEHVL